MSDAAGLDPLDRRIGGALLRPASDGYDQARRVFNAMIDRRPVAIVRCTSTDDVVAAVDHARQYELALSVKGGGHSVAGAAVCESGLMIDLNHMKGIRVDPVRRVAIAEPGLTLGEFDAATQAFGLATTTGVVSMTGIAGLTLGGGIGWLNGKHGLACDNLIEAEVVTADGQMLTASPNDHADLFWGLRGGGGNFGVVTSFSYRLHPVTIVLGGGVTFAPTHGHEALRFYHQFARDVPDELTTSASVSLDADHRPVVSIGVCYCGAIERGEELLRPVRDRTGVIADDIAPIGYTTLQNSKDAGFPEGHQHYWKASFLRDLTDDAIDAVLRGVANAPSPLTGIGFQQLSGVAQPRSPNRHRIPAPRPPLRLPHPLAMGRSGGHEPQHRLDPDAFQFDEAIRRTRSVREQPRERGGRRPRQVSLRTEPRPPRHPQVDV